MRIVTNAPHGCKSAADSGKAVENGFPSIALAMAFRATTNNSRFSSRVNTGESPTFGQT